MDNVNLAGDDDKGTRSAIAPRISIITVCFNAEAYIEQTIESVLGQTYPNIEYVVVDGGSKDGTRQIVQRYSDRIQKWVSEPDKGIADAMNKGLLMATGDFVLFLHADDYLLSRDAIAKAASQFNENNDIFAFCLYYKTADRSYLMQPRGFDWRINFKTGFWHQAVFCRKTLFDRIGGFDTSFRIAMDYEFFLRAYRRDICARLIDIPVAVMRDTGVSARRDWPSLRTRFTEERRAQDAHCPGMIWDWLYRVYWVLYILYRRGFIGILSY